MLCCICKVSEATVHLTQIAGEQVKSMDFCEACARKKGVNDPTAFALADVIPGLLPPPQSRQPRRQPGV